MDGDPAVESELDSFSLTFPLPYRVAFIVVLGTWHSGHATSPSPFSLGYYIRVNANEIPSQRSGVGASTCTTSTSSRSTCPR